MVDEEAGMIADEIRVSRLEAMYLSEKSSQKRDARLRPIFSIQERSEGVLAEE